MPQYWTKVPYRTANSETVLPYLISYSQHDSGGPLMYQMSSGRWIVIGIVSWGVRCGEAEHPGLYTKVEAYLPWIVANAQF